MSTKRALRAGMYAMATAALSATAFAGMAGTATADPGTEAQAKSGCPSGAVCLYSEQGWQNQNPEHVYWSYGVHPLENEYGTHMILNNQTGGATAAHCDTSDGHGCGKPFGPGTRVTFGDITPINSIRLMA